MARPQLRLLTPLAVVLASCAPADDLTCVDDAAFFQDEVYPGVVQDTCMACHTSDGAARESDLIFATPARPDHVEVNQAMLASVAGLERDGESIVLRKPLGEDSHGGGALFDRDDARWQLLEAFVERVKEPVACDLDGNADGDLGLKLLPPAETLQKATLLLAGRLPTSAELEAVRSGGEPALANALWAVMAEPAFTDVFVEKLNDLLLTDRYLNNDAIGIVDDDRFPEVYWYETLDGSNERSRARDGIVYGVAREPLALAAHLVENDLPWTELLTADYTMATDYSAVAFGVEGATVPDLDDPDAHRFKPVKVPGVPHAGLLTTTVFLNRYPTTPTNRNRHRSWFFYKTFLATDILTFADRPIDVAVSSAHNPTMNDAQCSVCHATMDPVAGLFQNWDEEGRYAPPEEGWYGDMRPPGFGDATLPAVDKTKSLAWLAQQAVDDPRFGIATVRTMLELFTGQEPLTALVAGDDPELKAALAIQDAWIQDVADEFGQRGHDVKYVVERVVTSHFFRAIDQDTPAKGALLQAGLAHLLTPEELDRKIVATLGMPWKSTNESRTYLQDDYRLLYGGIDSFGTVERLTAPNGVMGAIGLRMATDLACDALPYDLVLDRTQRRLLPLVELSYEPVTDDGFEVAGAKAAIVQNIRWLHQRLLGEDLPADDPEIQATWELWLATWRDGKEGLAAGEIDDDLPGSCQATRDPWTGDSLPGDHRITHDPDYTLRAWVAVTAYLLADWRFLHE